MNRLKKGTYGRGFAWRLVSSIHHADSTLIGFTWMLLRNVHTLSRSLNKSFGVDIGKQLVSLITKGSYYQSKDTPRYKTRPSEPTCLFFWLFGPVCLFVPPYLCPCLCVRLPVLPVCPCPCLSVSVFLPPCLSVSQSLPLSVSLPSCMSVSLSLSLSLSPSPSLSLSHSHPLTLSPSLSHWQINTHRRVITDIKPAGQFMPLTHLPPDKMATI